MSASADKLRGKNWLQRVFYFYVDGFRAMTLGRTLWAIIFIKVIVFFVIMRFVFFPNFLNSKADTDQGKADYVRHELMKKNVAPEAADMASEAQPTTEDIQYQQQ